MPGTENTYWLGPSVAIGSAAGLRPSPHPPANSTMTVVATPREERKRIDLSHRGQIRALPTSRHGPHFIYSQFPRGSAGQSAICEKSGSDGFHRVGRAGERLDQPFGPFDAFGISNELQADAIIQATSNSQVFNTHFRGNPDENVLHFADIEGQVFLFVDY